jgi:DNA-binding response OmpR family regulator
MTESRATILIVDDEMHFRQFLQRTLEGSGYSVVAAATGQEALDRLTEGSIDLVLMDIMMPGLNGYQALALIREKSDIPVIMVTGTDNITALRTSLNIGADDYIKKPFHSRELLARIDAKLRRLKQ